MPKALTVDGGWSWFADPRAVYSGGRIYTGWVDMQARVWVAQILDDRAAGYPVRRFLLSDRSVVGPEDVLADDHANPVILVRGGRVVAFWSGHGGPQMNYRIATRQQDVTAFGPVLTAPTPTGPYGNTYPNPWQLSDGKVYLTYRGAANFQPFVTRTDSLGVPSHWEQPRHMIAAAAGERPYLKAVAAGGSTLHLVFTDGHPRNVATSVYHAKYQNNEFKRTDGSVITGWTGLPFAVGQATRVFDGPAHGVRCWIWDIQMSASTGFEPRIIFSTLPDGTARTGHQYWYAAWTGTGWRTAKVADAGGTIAQDGEDSYSGGAVLDPLRPDSRMWLSRPDPVTGVHDIQMWTSTDSGLTWNPDPSRTLAPSTEQRVRPVAARDYPDPGRLLWMEGPYQTFTDFGTRLVLGDAPGAGSTPAAPVT
jgi:hypothetical protein